MLHSINYCMCVFLKFICIYFFLYYRGPCVRKLFTGLIMYLPSQNKEHCIVLYCIVSAQDGAVTKMSCHWAYALSGELFKKLGSFLGSIFLLFPMKVRMAVMLIVPGKIPCPHPLVTTLS